jgi:hypothetical protein
MISLLGFLTAGIVAGYALRGRAPAPAPESPTTPAPAAAVAACPQDFRTEYLDCRAALTAAKSQLGKAPEAVAPSPPQAPGERTTKQLRLSASASEAPDGETAVAAEGGRRLVAYMPYRAYRNYRLYKAYKSPKEEQPGTEEDCKSTPNARECVGTERFCQNAVSDDKCVGTEIYCAKFPNEEICYGTKHACARNPRSNGCEGTEYFCQDDARRNGPDCRGTPAYCESRKKTDPYCHGTPLFCGTYGELPICESDDV